MPHAGAEENIELCCGKMSVRTAYVLMNTFAGSRDGTGTIVIEEHKEPEASSSASQSKNNRSRQLRMASLYRAFRSRRAVEGSVESIIKGGFEIRRGKIRGFCPSSQIDLRSVGQPEQHVGQRYLFRISQLRRGGDDIVLSRRAILEDQQADEAKAVRATLIENAIMQGRVAGLADFGAFVDLGAGVSGLVHLSELSHSRVNRPEDAVTVGDLVNVKVLKLDETSNRISLSIRQAEKDPWSGIEEQVKAGKIHSGTVRRLTDFGAFVELLPGVEALAPGSEFPPSRLGWRNGLELDQTGDWLVLSVDPGQRRISVTSPVEGMDFESLPPLEEGKTYKGKVQRVERFGVFVWLGPGRVGLMPNIWSGTERGDDLTRRFPVGDEIEVDLVELSGDGKRIRLAKKGVEARAAGSGYGESRQPRTGRHSKNGPKPIAEERIGAQTDQEGFGSILADKLRAALGQPDDRS
jgi:small subunit ribosomal protein S1